VLLDTFGFARSELERIGLRKDAISASTVNTATNPKYYSHYATTRAGKLPGLNGFMAVMDI